MVGTPEQPSKIDEITLRTTLSRASRAVRSARAGYDGQDWFLRKDTVLMRRPSTTVDLYQFWFRTRGCTFDASGQCSMCNYGTGPQIDPDRVVASISEAISRVPPGSLIYLSPSGSLLDEHEVPADMRRKLLDLVTRRTPRAFTFETRPEFCSAAVLEEIRSTLPDAIIACHLGVESWDRAIRSLCHMKSTRTDLYVQAVQRLRALRIAPIANIVFGGLGLSAAEACSDTLATVCATRAAGFPIQMLFPLSAKSGSLLGWAYQRQLWEPPGLWQFLTVLHQSALEFGDAETDLDISWFNPQISPVVLARPDSCEACRPVLVDALRSFRTLPSASSLSAALDWTGCECQHRAQAALKDSTGGGYLHRLQAIAEQWVAANG